MSTSRFAVTIGAQESYDQALQKEGIQFKIGKRPNDNPPYEGGWVWQTAEEAFAFVTIQKNSLGFEAAVYELELPVSWKVDVSTSPSPRDGVYRLQHDARIIRRINSVSNTH